MKFLHTDKEVHEAVGGVITKRNWAVTGVSIDSRTILEGELFIAIKAERDGHEFLKSAIYNGAVAAIVNRIPTDTPKDFPCIVVKDSFRALNDLAHFSRKRYKGKLVAVTGSVGKTSTKSLLAEMLSKFGETYCSPQSYNNYLGVPLTLVNIPLDAKYVVAEIGMSSPGEIGPLSNLVAPDIGIITTISSAHLAAFDDIKDIAYEKAMICSGLVKNGLLIFSSETPFTEMIRGIVKKKKLRHTTFGRHSSNQIYLKAVSLKKNRTSINAIIKDFKNLNFDLHVLGIHHALNSLPVFGVLLDLNLDLNIAVNHMKDWKPVTGRGRFVDLKFNINSKNILIRVIDESYNSNPTSLKASFEVVKYVSFDDYQSCNIKPFRRIAILGDMLELGSEEEKIHKDLAQLEIINCFDLIYCVGTLMKCFYQALPSGKKGLAVRNPKELIPHLLKNIEDGDVYLIKGSNSIGLSLLVSELCGLNGRKISR